MPILQRYGESSHASHREAREPRSRGAGNQIFSSLFKQSCDCVADFRLSTPCESTTQARGRRRGATRARRRRSQGRRRRRSSYRARTSIARCPRRCTAARSRRQRCILLRAGCTTSTAGPSVEHGRAPPLSVAGEATGRGSEPSIGDTPPSFASGVGDGAAPTLELPHATRRGSPDHQARSRSRGCARPEWY